MVSFMTLPHLRIGNKRVGNEFLSTVVLSTSASPPSRFSLPPVNVSNGTHTSRLGNVVLARVNKTVVALICLAYTCMLCVLHICICVKSIHTKGPLVLFTKHERVSWGASVAWPGRWHPCRLYKGECFQSISFPITFITIKMILLPYIIIITNIIAIRPTVIYHY